tara:strand:+ start:170 stop:421 length:252 start_codon:yes stop_codon:yes gene_type:complete
LGLTAFTAARTQNFLANFENYLAKTSNAEIVMDAFVCSVAGLLSLCRLVISYVAYLGGLPFGQPWTLPSPHFGVQKDLTSHKT